LCQKKPGNPDRDSIFLLSVSFFGAEKSEIETKQNFQSFAALPKFAAMALRNFQKPG
jgi:hypothetical protein